MRKLVSALVLLLAACGGGGGGGTQPQVAAATRPVLVVAYGDSTQEGYPTNTPPAAQAQSVLRASGLDVTITADAHGGTTAEQMLLGTDGSGLPWAERLRASHANVVTIKHGINGTATAQEHAQTLRTLILTAREQGITVLVETPNPVVPGGGAPPDLIIGIDARTAATRQVAAELSAPLCDHDAAIRQMGWADLAHLPDGVHPSTAVYAFMGQKLAECLAPLVH